MSNLDVVVEKNDVILRLNSEHILVSVDSKYASELNLDAEFQIEGIGPEACRDMKELRNLFADVKWIGKESFAGCSQLEEIHLSDSVSRIDEGAFAGVPAKFVQFDGTSEQWLDLIRNSKWAKSFDNTVIVKCANNEDLCYGELAHAK